jgi:prepilin-type processing-associated H-X9-DG protein
MVISTDELRNGLALERDLVLPERPSNPEMRESASVWMFEESGAFGFPRMGVEAEASSWDDRLFQANFAFADGRVLDGSGRGKPPSPLGPDGRPTVLGAGSVVFRCIEPFRRWSLHFDGPAVDGHVSDQIAKTIDPNRKIHVRLDAEMTMVVPAWGQENAEKDASLEAALMGLGYRFEQLFRAEGVFDIDGSARPFKATGLRIHRQSIRRLEGFFGHCWQSAVFPDGRAFGYIAYPPKPDGTETYNEGFIYQDGKMIPAQVVEAPWLRRIVESGDDVSLVLASALGRTRIEGSTALSTFRVGNPHIGGLNLQQSGVLYRWGDQSAYGMIERSAHESLTTVIPRAPR